MKCYITGKSMEGGTHGTLPVLAAIFSVIECKQGKNKQGN